MEDYIFTIFCIILITVMLIISFKTLDDISTIKENVENITSIETECIKINEKIYCEKENK